MRENIFSSFKPVKQIISEGMLPIFDLKNRERYYAHTSIGKNKETLEEHQTLVNNYFIAICEEMQLDGVIDKLIDTFVNGCYQGNCDERVKSFIKELFCGAIIFHDFGKINENFQADKKRMDNSFFETNLNSPIGTKHSQLGEYLFITYQLSRLAKFSYHMRDRFISLYCIFGLSYPIAKHHSPFLQKLDDEIGFEKEELLFMAKYLDCFKWDISEPFRTITQEKEMVKTRFLTRLSQFYEDMTVEFPLYALTKLCSSLLNASDYLATAHYMNGWTKMYDQYGVLNDEQKNRIVTNLRNTQSYNRAVYDELETFKLICPQEPSKDNLNRLRSEMVVEVIRNVRANADKRLFYIEAPTGGGKTNLSMVALAELIEHDIRTEENNINKVFYVFPFTTLITQTYAVLEETLSLGETEIIELHSKAGFKETGKDDDVYGEHKNTYLDNLFVNYPVVVTSHVKFFDILKTNRKETNYLLHRIANSVVIIDELQSYSPEQWDKLIYLIDSYAEYFNIKFILMSATLPKIGRLTWSDKIPDFVSLIADKNKYFQNENFRGRVNFDFSLLKWKKPNSNVEKEFFLNKLCDKVFEESEAYAKCAGSVFTIIEFIIKRTASDFYKLVENNNNFFEHIFVLSGTIIEPRRREIIEFIKDKSNRGKNILLITTQVVEAGVDIDMDLGFKDKSLVDSEEQLAGRINRNVLKSQCVLFIFDCDNASLIYGSDQRYDFLRQLPQEAYEKMLVDKSFDTMYDILIDKRKIHNDGIMNKGVKDYRQYIRALNYKEVNDSFKLIDGQNYTVFVDVDVPLQIPNSEKFNFTKAELLFMLENGAYQVEDSMISGRRIWKMYSQVIQSKSDDFVMQKVRLKKMQGILSKFTFSLFVHSKDAKALVARGYKDEDLGFILLSNIMNEDAIYSYESGLSGRIDDEPIFL